MMNTSDDVCDDQEDKVLVRGREARRDDKTREEEDEGRGR